MEPINNDLRIIKHPEIFKRLCLEPLVKALNINLLIQFNSDIKN